ncbi:hypothetical protein D3C87_299610 [compost metagenome]
MTWLANLIDHLSEQLFGERTFYYHKEQLAFERRREQIRRDAYFPCRTYRD